MTMTTAMSEFLTRQEIWDPMIKETLKDQLIAMPFLREVGDFMDGEEKTFPSVGDALAEDYTENTDVNYTGLDTGEFKFTIDQYKQSATYVTNKNLQDAFYMNTVVSAYPQKQVRAIMQQFETKIWKDPETALGAAGANNTYTINGLMHRFAGGLSTTANTLDLLDFSYAHTALSKANVPLTDLVAIVPPEIEHKINSLTNIVSLDNNPNFNGIIETGISTGFRYVRNIFGFSVFVSNYLPDTRTLSTAPTTLVHRDGSTAGPDFSSVEGRPCYFFSAAGGDVNPFLYSFRQQPQLDMFYNHNKQRTEMVTTARWGSKIWRPENMVIAFTALTMA